MSPEQAKTMLEMYCDDVQREGTTTRKVLASVPEDQVNYRPGGNEKAMTALDLAWHTASSEIWFLEGVAAGSFAMEEGKRPEDVQSIAAVLNYYDRNLGPSLEKAKAISGEEASKVISFFDAFHLPAFAYLGFCVKHSVHHRGQMSAYLRGMGARVPSIYGGSADEPFEMPKKEEAAAVAGD